MLMFAISLCLQLILAVLLQYFYYTYKILFLSPQNFLLIYSVSHQITIFYNHNFVYTIPFPGTLTSSFYKYSNAIHSLRFNKNMISATVIFLPSPKQSFPPLKSHIYYFIIYVISMPMYYCFLYKFPEYTMCGDSSLYSLSTLYILDIQ